MLVPVRSTALARLGAAASLLLALSSPAAPIQAAPPAQAGPCRLASPVGSIQHVVYLQFDNVHFTRDDPNVPSDLEQMPHLLDVLRSNGVVLTQHHTPLIAHTAGDIMTALTGLYPSHHGLAVTNSYRYFKPDGTTGSAPAFTYWTDPVNDSGAPSPTNTSFNLVGADGRNVPAPWVPFTRAGCNVGMVGMNGAVLENVGPDVTTIFGADSPEAAAAAADKDQATADFVGVAVHCAQGSAVCATGRPDVLPQEPGGYEGFKGLFGHKYVAPQISPSGPLADLGGHTIVDAKGRVGFPGFDSMTPSVTLGYVAAMQERGIPITYAYLSDAHDPHVDGAAAFGPGEAGYVATLKAYDDGFAAFFARLAKDGINPSNTLFVATADEGDHFAGSAPGPEGCDGVTVPCTYSQVGQVNLNLTGLLAEQAGITTPFRVHADAAPTIYLDGNPAPGSAEARAFARALGQLTVDNPYSGQSDPVTWYLADPVEEQVLHMVTGDPARTPTLTQFANPTYYLNTGNPDCSTPCVTVNPTGAWGHGTVAPDVNTTWLGLAGPGVRRLGVDSQTWTDHTDVRPTLMALVGLKDDYAHDGRALFEVLDDRVVPSSARESRAELVGLAQMYERLNAPVGEFGLGSLAASTAALASASAGDEQYLATAQALADLGRARDDVAVAMIGVLESATFGGRAPDAGPTQALLVRGQALLDEMAALATGSASAAP